MAISIHTWRVTGISPLLQNNPAGTMDAGDGSGMSSGKKKYVDQDEAEMRVYRNERGEIIHPTAAFRSGMLEASKGRKIGKTSARVVVAGAVLPCEPEVIITDAKGKPITKYEIHKCRVMVGKNGVLRCRPMYRDWHADLALEVDDDFIGDADLVTDLLNIAGRTVGIGDFRPDTSKGKGGIGTFGRYRVELKQ